MCETILNAKEAIELGDQIGAGMVAEFSNDQSQWFKRTLKQVADLPKGFTTDSAADAKKKKVSRWAYMRLIQTEAPAVGLFEEVSFEEAAKPLMKYLSENHHPHTTAIVSGNTAELLEGLRFFKDDSFIVD